MKQDRVEPGNEDAQMYCKPQCICNILEDEEEC